MRLRSLLTGTLMVMMLFPAVAQAHDYDRGPQHGYKQGYEWRWDDHGGPPASWNRDRDYERNHRNYTRPDFSQREEQMIYGFYRSNYAQPYPMPQSRMRQIYRSGYLPDGVMLQTLPVQLVRKLGPAPRGYERYIMGRDVILVSTRDGAIISIISNVL